MAVASDTYRPLLVRPIANGEAGTDYEVLEIGTLPRAEADFSKPQRVVPDQPTSTRFRVTGELELAEASHELGTQPVWAGPELDGLKLAAVQRQEITAGWGPDSGVPPRVTPVIALIYGDVVRGHPTAGSITIIESTEPFSTWALPAMAPPAGSMSLSQMGWATLQAGNVYVQVIPAPLGASAGDRVSTSPRTLTPVPAG